MILEKIKLENLSDLKGIGDAFTTEVDYPGGFVLEEFLKLWEPLLRMDMGVIFVIREPCGYVAAALGCSFIRDGFNGRNTACEHWWFAHKVYRGMGVATQLFDAFEAEAAARGAKKLLMGRLETPQAEKLEQLYASRGFKPLEKTFVKDL